MIIIYNNIYYFRQSTGCVWWIPRLFSPPTMKAMATEKSFGFLSLWTWTWVACELPKTFNLRTWVSEPPQNLKTQSLEPQPQILLGTQEWWIPVPRIPDLPKNLPQFLAVSPLNLHTIIIWSFIIIWSLYNHHRIIIWSQRLDVLKMEEVFLAADQYNSPFSASAPLRGSKSVFSKTTINIKTGKTLMNHSALIWP